MDSQEKTSASVREGNLPDHPKNEDSKVPTEMSKPVEGQHKPIKGTEATKKVKKVKSAKKYTKSKLKKSKKQVVVDGSSSDSSSDDAEDSSSDSDLEYSLSESDSAGQSSRKRSSKKRRAAQKSKKHVRTADRKKPVKGKARQRAASDSGSDSSDSDSDNLGDLGSNNSQIAQRGQQDLVNKQLQLMQQYQYQYQQQLQNSGNVYQYPNNTVPPQGLAQNVAPIYNQGNQLRMAPLGGGGLQATGQNLALGGLNRNLAIDNEQQRQGDIKKGQKPTKLDYKRVDQVWDNSLHSYKLQPTAQDVAEVRYDGFLFQVRRTFDWEGKYKATIVDIKSKLLRECLQEVMGDIKGVSLVDEVPKLDPNMLFLYLEELRKHVKTLKRARPSKGNKHERKKEEKRLKSKRQHLKILLKYIDKDYAVVKASLYPMLENGLITFDLLWALWKPKTLALTTTYGSPDERRAFRVEMAEKRCSMSRGQFYNVEGKYLEFDGKQFGYGSIYEEVPQFRGACKITSLPCYPLQYDKDEAKTRKELIERGKKFVSLGGVHYKSHEGMAYYKKKKGVVKIHINGRIMVDARIHRRINPNYPVSLVRPTGHDDSSDSSDSDADESSDCADPPIYNPSYEDNGDDGSRLEQLDQVNHVTKATRRTSSNSQGIQVPKANGEEAPAGNPEQVPNGDEVAEQNGIDELGTTDDNQPPQFTDEEYLIASPVVLGFAFDEKLWVEFTVSGVKEVQWNDNAYQSLVLEPKTKDIVRALVESHKYHAAESIDDVIVGKGKGLVAVLHGPPGTGKTLTAEGISDLLKCPLYTVSAGELGTDSRYLEAELQKILDICHTWGAILLLDEADVFLEKRNMQDIHRNALVSIFLRQLEYFQGILFLTTNRVETFDDAFQSRIHIALRYDNLDTRAKKAIFKIFIERVRALTKMDMKPFTENDLDALARHELNGRQIKNTVRTAQALAVNKREPLSMKHIRQVLDVQKKFETDLKGGTGYHEAMRSYS